MGKKYYRSDSRAPSIIFEDGFIVREKSDHVEGWLSNAIHRYKPGRVVDADPDWCISISKKFNSAAYFPCIDPDDDEDLTHSFIYELDLPEPSIIRYDSGQYQFLDGNDNWRNKVVDFHEFQREDGKNILRSSEILKSSEQIKKVNWALFGEEAFCYHIPQHQIIGCVEVTNRRLEILENGQACVRYDARNPLNNHNYRHNKGRTQPPSLAYLKSKTLGEQYSNNVYTPFEW